MLNYGVCLIQGRVEYMEAVQDSLFAGQERDIWRRRRNNMNTRVMVVVCRVSAHSLNLLEFTQRM